MAIEDRKQNRFVDAKTVWSVSTRAPMVRLGRAGKFIRRARKENQVVAAGPKIAAGEGRGSPVLVGLVEFVWSGG